MPLKNTPLVLLLISLLAGGVLFAACSPGAGTPEVQLPRTEGIWTLTPEAAVVLGSGVQDQNNLAAASATPTSLPVIVLPTETPADTATPTLVPSPTLTPIPPTPAPPIAGVENARAYFSGQMEFLDDAGSDWLRRNGLRWSLVEPVEGSLNWGAVASLEKELAAAAGQGLEMILIVRSPPGWAQRIPGVACGPIKEEKLAAFASFLNAAVARYSAPPYEVKYWELWNEPDVSWSNVPGSSQFGCWGDSDDPNHGGKAYAEMLRAVYPHIKAADPEAQVLVGGLLLDCNPINPPETPPGSGTYKECTSGNFLRGILENGGGDFFDGVSFHAYDYYYAALGDYRNPNWHSAWDETGPVLIAKTRFLKNLLAEYGFPDKYLINTEAAILCGQSGNEPLCRTTAFRETKANYLVQAFTAARAEGLRANIWFSLFGWRGSEIMTLSRRPLPIMDVYTFSAAQLADTVFLNLIIEYPGVRGYRFNRAGTELWVLWSLTTEPQTVLLPNYPAAVYDIYGEPLPKERTLEITLAPVYIEW